MWLSYLLRIFEKYVYLSFKDFLEFTTRAKDN